jgi:rubredoxin
MGNSPYRDERCYCPDCEIMVYGDMFTQVFPDLFRCPECGTFARHEDLPSIRELRERHRG